ncbi:MAG TPA: hypothetical protein VJT15_05760 [Pyrinomonadaceae bacterium]|nr:hypothetical protein [Pyrinomonadaceae bacterium]
MAQVPDSPLNDDQRRSIFLVGDQPYNTDRVIKESLEAGLQVVVTKLASDHSEAILAQIHRDSDDHETQAQPHAIEILPDDVTAITDAMLTRLRHDYGDNCFVMPFNDYVMEYAAVISGQLSGSCYPPRSADITKRKHELRALWNRLAEQPDADDLHSVEYCYVEQRANDVDAFDYHPSSGFEALPENTPLIVKPDELSSSIEIHYAKSKQEAVSLVGAVCAQLHSKWYAVGQSIGTEVRPRVIMEMAIPRSTALHPGAEFSIEFVSFEGQHYPVGVVQKWLGPDFIEMGQFFPAESFPERLRPALERAIHQLLEQLEVRYGVSHWEFIITPDERIALVEGHLRPAGGRIMELVEHSTGRSPTSLLCEAMAQGTADFSFTPRTSCGIFWMIPETPLTTVTEVKVAHDATDAQCKDLYLNEQGILATQNWSQATDWMTRFAHVIAIGANLDAVLERSRAVAQSVILSGNTSDTPALTPLKLAIDQ